MLRYTFCFRSKWNRYAAYKPEWRKGEEKSRRKCKKARLKRNALNMYIRIAGGRRNRERKGESGERESTGDKANLFVLATLSCTFLHLKWNARSFEGRMETDAQKSARSARSSRWKSFYSTFRSSFQNYTAIFHESLQSCNNVENIAQIF